MKLLLGFTLLLGFQIAGEAIVRVAGLPVPGPVVGLLLLLVLLVARPSLETRIAPASGALLAHLSLLFVPAGVGVVVHLHRLEGALVGVATTLALGTLAGLAVTSLLLQALLRGTRQRELPLQRRTATGELSPDEPAPSAPEVRERRR